MYKLINIFINKYFSNLLKFKFNKVPVVSNYYKLGLYKYARQAQ